MLLALGLGYAAWGFLDESGTRAVVMMDFTSMASNIRQSIAQQTIKPIWDDAESNAIPAAVMIETFLLTQYGAHLAGRARILPQGLLWRSVMLHGLLVTHIGFYRLGQLVLDSDDSALHGRRCVRLLRERQAPHS